MRIDEISTPPDVAEALKGCQAAVNSKHSLYRGITMRPFKEQFVRSIRQDRMLKDSAKHEGAIFDAYCEVLGFPHRKANTLSTAKSTNQASEYGITVFEIFPEDGSSYLYSTTHRDFLDISLLLLKRWSEANMFDSITKASHEQIVEFISAYKNRLMELAALNVTQSLDEAVANAKGEVLIYGSKYVGKFYDHLQ